MIPNLWTLGSESTILPVKNMALRSNWSKYYNSCNLLDAKKTSLGIKNLYQLMQSLDYACLYHGHKIPLPTR